MANRLSKKQRMAQIIKILSTEYPDAHIELTYTNSFNLLVATILSAQCTDVRVNQVTKVLFKKLKVPEDYVKVDIEELEQLIYSTGYYKAKAKNIKSMSEKLLEDFDGNIPSTMDELLTLPGVGRKTANVILGHCFEAEGIVVDTHVVRLSNRIGFVETKNAVIIERELLKLVPKELWSIFTHYFINHGRKVCSARKPQCKDCAINTFCLKKI